MDVVFQRNSETIPREQPPAINCISLCVYVCVCVFEYVPQDACVFVCAYRPHIIAISLHNNISGARVMRDIVARSEQNDALLHRAPADRTADDLVAAHLARAVTAQEHHVLLAIKAHRAHGLQIRSKDNIGHLLGTCQFEHKRQRHVPAL